MNNIHMGVYGIYIENDKILLIKKARGPYIGMYDLPGGGIEYGETISECLKREIYEETGTQLLNCNFIGNNEYICEYMNPKNEPKKSHHIGFYYKVELSYENIKTGPDFEDSLGSEFIDIKELDQIKLSPIAKPMIEKALSMIDKSL
ncbi:MAG: NUDIX domain-containing protein [Candidatus Gracilibacteria bacterium]|nr:NUDIX domain-containing protein [Candidatus Gracilibacteria bacterium]